MLGDGLKVVYVDISLTDLVGMLSNPNQVIIIQQWKIEFYKYHILQYSLKYKKEMFFLGLP